MPAKITAEALAALGAPTLAAALLAYAEDDPILRKNLRMLLAGTAGPGKLAAEIGERIQIIGRARSYLERDQYKSVILELDNIRTTISTTLAAQDKAAAIERLWDLIGIADRVFARLVDGMEAAHDMFGAALADLGRLLAADPDRDVAALARRVIALCDSDEFGTFDGLVDHFGAALGTDGRAMVRAATQKALAALPPRKRDDWAGAIERWPLIQRLLTLADLDHDPDAYIAALKAGEMEHRGALDIARRLIDAGRPAEALQWLDGPGKQGALRVDAESDLRIDALAALGRKDEAQTIRWEVFERRLSIEHLRAYLKALPDFEDFEAEQKAIAIALRHSQAELALDFLVRWPALDRAAALVRERVGTMDGRHYEVLREAAQALQEKYPDAATLLYRQLVAGVLDRGSSKQYTYAARDLISATSVARRLPPDAAIESSTTYLARLRDRHGRKHGFWTLVDQKA